MTKPLIALPCTAQEPENALHAACDHDGLWGAVITTEMDEHYKDILVIHTKGEINEE